MQCFFVCELRIEYPLNRFCLLGICLGVLLFFSECRTDPSADLPDISDIEVESDIDRFEQDFFTLNELPEEKIPEEIEELRKSYPYFFEFYNEALMELYTPQASESEKLDRMKAFMSDSSVLAILDSCRRQFPDLKFLEDDLNEAFRYYHYYYPNRKTPHFVSFLGGFNSAALTLDSVLIGVNLDMHLGANLPYYDMVGYPRYQSRRFEPEYMIVNMMKVLGQELVPEDSRQNKMIDQMIRNGKVLYFLDKVLPEKGAHLKIGYTEEQFDWCVKNETDVWSFLIENDLLFSTNRQKYSKYVLDGPTSTGMPLASPGNIGSWVGWQIVKRFAENNSDYTLDEILEIESGEEVLRKSRYKPRMN